MRSSTGLSHGVAVLSPVQSQPQSQAENGSCDSMKAFSPSTGKTKRVSLISVESPESGVPTDFISQMPSNVGEKAGQ